ncbi:MAG: hypothetical protein EA353_06520 [Puniceicoccaceae bacterium]|nr:MAG: hypothetical protein EA353_06520 [Puniceicoccaceae bacterium]
MNFSKIFLLLTLLLSPLGVSLAVSPAQTSALASWKGTVFRIEDTRTRVSLASVMLSVSDLKPENGNLVGDYTIRVPLMQSKNDRGKIILPLDISMDDLGTKGGTLRGQAISFKEDTTPNAIVCRIVPGEKQAIYLDITTDDRTLQFESRYTIVIQPKDS